MRKVYDFVKNNRLLITGEKFAIMSILMLLALKWAIFCEILLVVAIVFALTEFDFDGFYIPFFLVSFRFIFRHSLGGGIPYVEIVFCVYAIYAVIKYFIIKKEKFKVNWWVVGFSVAYLIYVFISLKLTGFSLRHLAKHALMMVMINFLFIFKNKIDFKKLIISFVLGVLSAGIIEWITQYFFADKFTIMDMAAWDHQGNLRHRGLAGDPNYYAMDILIAVAGLYFLNVKNKVNKIFYYLSMCLLVILLYFTYSKSGIVGLLIFVVLSLVFTLTLNVKKWFKVVAILGVVAVSFLSIFVIFRKDPFATLIRFNETYYGEFIHHYDSETNTYYDKDGNIVDINGDNENATIDKITTGRWTLWKNHLNFSFSSAKNFFLGGGIGTHVEPMEAHNTYIQVFYETGFIGLCLLVGVFLSICFGMELGRNNFKPKNWINFLIFLMGMFLFANVNYLAVTSFIYHLTLMMCTWKDCENEKENKIENNKLVEKEI